MQLKDYYQTLELHPSATLTEIKKAYRRLAQKFHPDKNANDAASVLHFAEIKEAYEVLSNPSKKEYYLQQRWYQQSIGRKNFQKSFTATGLLQQSLNLERYVSKLDVHRMDKEGLLDHIIDLIPDEVIEKLNAVKDEAVNNQIVQTLLASAQQLSLSQLIRLGEQIKKIQPEDFSAQQVELFIERKRRTHYWDRARPWIVLLMVLLLCLLIFFSTK